MTWLTPVAWFIIALALMLIELAVPGILLFFFGIGALVTALLSWMGVLQSTSLQLLVFLAVSVATLLLFRKKLQKTFRGTAKSVTDPEKVLDEFVGKIARVVEAINPSEQRGKVEFHGAHWEARAETPIEPGTAVEILSRNNLILIVKPKRRNNMKTDFIGPLVIAALILLVVIILFKTARVVPQRQAFIVERLGKFSKTLEAGFHLLIPFVEIVAYKLTLKEEAMDVPPQQCITRDNVTVEVDGVLYLQVMEPDKAAYGIANYKWATIQLAQTTMRSMIGKIELDRTFEERDTINAGVVDAVDKASEPWGIKVTRYEIKNISPPASIMDAMEKQMRAEREKRATIAESEGNRQARINVSEGLRQEAIMVSEGEKRRLINEAEGRAQQIELVAQATAKGFREVASALREAGGMDAMNLRIAEKYIEEFGKLAKTNNTMILPSNVADLAASLQHLAAPSPNRARKKPPTA